MIMSLMFFLIFAGCDLLAFDPCDGGVCHYESTCEIVTGLNKCMQPCDPEGYGREAILVKCIGLAHYD
jgi:hypothetical protein